MDNIFKIVGLLENSGLLSDGAAETVKHNKFKKASRLISWCSDDPMAGIDITYGFFINKSYI